MTYAARTDVPVDRSRTEIEATLKRYGAKSFAYFTEKGRAIVIFEAADRRVRFDLPLPEGTSAKEQQQQRSRWRALALCIKAKLESVESKIETFEEAFLAHVMMPDGITVGQHTKPLIEQSYKSGDIPPLLPAPNQRKIGRE